MKNLISTRFFIGIIIVLAASLTLCFNLGVIPDMGWKSILISWPALLMLLGLLFFIHGNYRSGLFVLSLGTLLILPKIFPMVGLNYPESTVRSIIWTLAFILFGLWLMLGHFIPSNTHFRGHYSHNRYHNRDCQMREDGSIDYNLMMNGVDEIFLKPVFRGGKISTMMGGIKLDLRKTTIPEGITKLRVDSMFGGISLFVPENWNVEVHSSSFLGGFSDNRISNNDDDKNKKLIIVANLFMGGGEIKC